MTTRYKHLSLAMKWRGLPGFDQDLSQALTLIRYLPDKLFKHYEPDRYTNFLDRLDCWLENVRDDEDKKDLIRLLRHVLFFGKDEMDALMRSAFSVNFTRWIVEQTCKTFFDPSTASSFSKAIDSTWFCSVTDMNLSAFYHINNLKGSTRPDWNSLVTLGGASAIGDYIAKSGVNRVVFLEDFVGSGRQMARIVRTSKQLLPKGMPTLLCPLIICPAGDSVGRKLEASLPNFSYSPTLVVPARRFIQKKCAAGEPTYFSRLRKIIKKYEKEVQETPSLAGTRWGKNPFGYQGSGALVVLYTNCPNNTIRIIHHDKNWSPLFLRSER